MAISLNLNHKSDQMREMFNAATEYAVLWGTWFASGGSDGEEPPEVTRTQMDLWHQIEVTAEEADRKELFRQILEIAKEQFYAIGTVSLTGGYGIVKNNFHNVPEEMPEANFYRTPGATNPEQYFIE